MKNTIMIGLLSLASIVGAQTIVVQNTDVVKGYDGECRVYFRPDFGYFEICQENQPVFLGVEFEGIHFQHGGFRKETTETTTIHEGKRSHKWFGDKDREPRN
jgi:hypothetical protein